jgi:hypothetical protein
MAATEPVELYHALDSFRDGKRLVRVAHGLADAAQTVADGRAQRIVTASRRSTDLIFLASTHGLEPALCNGVDVMGDRLIDLLPDGAWSDDPAPTMVLDDVSITKRTVGGLVEDCERLTGSRDAVEDRLLLGSMKDPREILRLHGEFAELFARNLIPYCTDFVQSEAIELAPSKFLEILNDRAWESVDVTGAHGVRCRAGANSLFPVGRLRERFLGRLGDARRLVEVIKIRAFFTYTPRSFAVRFVPIVLTRGLPMEGLVDWLGHPKVDLAAGRRNEAKTLKAAAALVSMILSTALFDVFQQFLADEHRTPVTRDEKFLRLVAGSQFADLVNPALVDTLECVCGHLGASEPDGSAGPQDLFVWPGGKRSDGAVVQISDPEVRPVFALLEGQELPVTKPLPLHQLCEQTQASAAAVSLALDVLNDNSVAKNTYEILDGAVHRCTSAAEHTGTYTDYSRSAGGGRLAAVATRLEVDRGLTTQQRLEALAAL